ncbi:hypothetical protein GDO78_003490 [Eleutherodactylus coqui]|uniref:Uncharacterized protein n=1 Tax=Eleutherodactylus coqui TaxID=57060 RepID=A0A8J6EUJ5_ELECQ|nr:hypothetical protein GDO78_003490 [Eleutherodactylus coqui]
MKSARLLMHGESAANSGSDIYLQEKKNGWATIRSTQKYSSGNVKMFQCILHTIFVLATVPQLHTAACMATVSGTLPAGCICCRDKIGPCEP